MTKTRPSRYEEIAVSYWDDPDMEDWPTIPHLLYPCLWSNRYAHGITGLYRITDAQLMALAHMTEPSDLAACFDVWKGKVKRYPGAWLWVVNRCPYGCVGPKHLIHTINYMESVPEPMRSDFLAKHGGFIRAMGDRYGIDTVSIGYGKGIAPTPTPTPIPIPKTKSAPGPSVAVPYEQILAEMLDIPLDTPGSSW